MESLEKMRIVTYFNDIKKTVGLSLLTFLIFIIFLDMEVELCFTFFFLSSTSLIARLHNFFSFILATVNILCLV